MHNGNEWYWNLNLHRDKLALINASANEERRTNLPIPSAFYTSAVLTDVGICVGMRNVNLNGENQSCLHPPQKIPNCYNNNLSVVGQRNKQTWSTAFDRMRYASLTDPSMTVLRPDLNVMPPGELDFNQLPGKVFNVHRTKCYDPKIVEVPECCWNCEFSSVDVGADTNPFHLFGDNTNFSMVDFHNERKIGHHYPCKHHAMHAMPSIKEIANILHDPCSFRKNNELFIPTTSPNCCSLPNVSEPPYNGSPILGYPSTTFAPSLLPPPPPSSFLQASTLHNLPSTPATSTIKARIAAMATQHANAPQKTHVAAPKKKWIRNFMQSKFFSTFFCHSRYIFVVSFFLHSIVLHFCCRFHSI